MAESKLRTISIDFAVQILNLVKLLKSVISVSALSSGDRSVLTCILFSLFTGLEQLLGKGVFKGLAAAKFV